MRKKLKAFTIVELLVVIAIIGILATIGIVSFRRVQINARDSQRSARITVIAEALEKYYDKNGEYPNCNAMSQTASTITANTLVGMRTDVLAVPSGTSGTNSILASCGDLTTGTDAFAYVGDGSIPCLTGTEQTSACVQYTLKYLEESTNNIVSVTSRRRMIGIDVPAMPTVAVTRSGGNILATITPVTCSVGTTQYQINSRINNGTWVGYTDWSTVTTATQIANEGVKYSYQAQARCYVSTANLSLASTGLESTNTTTITAPAAPVVTANTVAATTTWSWPAVACAAGTTVRYQYQYTIPASGYNSGLIATAGLSLAFTTATEGYTYTVSVQAQCYTANTTSSWGAADADSYTRVNTVPVLTATTASSTSINLSWGAITGATNYILQRDTVSSFATATQIASQATTTFTTSGLSQGDIYYFRVNDTGPGGTSAWSATKSAVTTITAPAAPVVTANTAGATTTWSWPAVVCAAGTTVRYQYQYTIPASGYNSGLIATASTSFAAATATEGYTYTVSVQAQCYTADATSGWGTADVTSYYRPIPLYTLTITAGAGGSVNAGGTYNSGTVRTITATSSGYYAFSSWSGSTGCSGVASHTITMNADKSCTANFTLNASWLAIGTQIWAKANLNVGTMITGATEQTNNAILEKYCSADLESNCTTYKALYQWNEAMQYVTTAGAQGICPVGSHIPTDNDWKILEMQLGMTQAQADATSWRGTDQGTQLKPGGASGLDISLAGGRSSYKLFYLLSSNGNLWSSSESDTKVWYHSLVSDYATVERNIAGKVSGFSVRCVGN